MADYNPFLTASGNKGGGLFLENPAAPDNIVWQTRSGDLTVEEEALANALTQAFAGGAESLDACAAALNGQGLVMPIGGPWTAAGLGEYLAGLADPSL